MHQLKESVSAKSERYLFGALERRLFLITVVGLLPLAALAFTTLSQSTQRQKRELFASYQGTAQAIISTVDSELAAALSSLDALVASPRLARNDFDGLHAEARDLLTRRPNWLTVVLSDPSAQQLMNTYLPLGTPLPRGIHTESIEETVRTGEPGVGNVIYSPVLEKHAFSVRVPVKRNGETKYVLTAVMRPDGIQQILAGQRLVDNGVAVVVDRAYNVVARTLAHQEFFAKPASDGLVQLLEQGQQSGWSITNTLEEVPVYTIYYRSPRTGWSAAIGIPTAVLDAPVRRSYILLGGLVLASVLLGLVAALLVSRGITKPMRQLKRAADAVGAGKAPQPPKTSLPEINRVAAALVTAHAQLESLLKSERSARASEHDARVIAEQASRMKDEFIAMLGHELRNPLAAVSSASLVLEHSIREATVDPMARNATAIIRRQTQHLSRLTEDLLEAGRVVVGRIQLDRKPADLAAIVQSTVDAFRNAHRLGDDAIAVALESVWVNADATRIDQIVTNLLGNAVKYTPAPGMIEVTLQRDGDEAVLRVSDSGIGIEPELMPRIFDLFAQGQRALDRSQGGLGIGLTLVRRLVELHGGQVSVHSEGTGRGSEFTVRIPALDASYVPSDEEVPHDVGSRRIAVVEDNDDVRASLKQLLQINGHEVLEASDGRSAVELILSASPDVALIDIGLPLLDGFAVARAVRADSRGAAVRLVAMTGYGSPEDVRNGRRAGFDDYLVKPIDPSILRDLIGSTIGPG